MVSIEITGLPSIESWYHVWEEFVAVEGMCTRNGKTGEGYGLGKSLLIM